MEMPGSERRPNKSLLGGPVPALTSSPRWKALATALSLVSRWIRPAWMACFVNTAGWMSQMGL